MTETEALIHIAEFMKIFAYIGIALVIMLAFIAAELARG